MSRRWLSIPLEEYEGHMSAAAVGQQPVLAELFQSVLSRWRPESVAVLGVAGGNGLEAVDSAVTKRVVGVDINPKFLDMVERRFGALPGLELHCCDLAAQAPGFAPVELVHAALFFEHAGVDRALENALSLVSSRGRVSVVLQLPGAEAEDVALTNYASMQTLKDDFTLIDVDQFRLEMASRGFQAVDQQTRALPGGKAFWLGVFAGTGGVH